MLLLRLTNTLIFLFTAICFLMRFRKDGQWNFSYGLHSLRYFTILSNMLSGFAALLVSLTVTDQGLPFGIWLLKYMGTVSMALR